MIGLTEKSLDGCDETCAPRFRRHAFISTRSSSISENLSPVTRTEIRYGRIRFSRRRIKCVDEAIEDKNGNQVGIVRLEALVQAPECRCRNNVTVQLLYLGRPSRPFFENVLRLHDSASPAGG